MTPLGTTFGKQSGAGVLLHREKGAPGKTWGWLRPSSLLAVFTKQLMGASHLPSPRLWGGDEDITLPTPVLSGPLLLLPSRHTLACMPYGHPYAPDTP